ncbi:MAG: protoheme IX farnesyltransferase [Proteobacteria bacterium]|nr:MAG: protoheme IX farnesyltransferase [Pseudomonadota bacterium]
MKANVSRGEKSLVAGASGPGALLREYYQLTKPRVVGLIIFTAVVGMFLSTPGMVSLDVLLLGTLGIGLAAASGAAMNQILDRDADSVMKRTRHRPLPSGHLNAMQAMVFACILSMASMLILSVWVNTVTAVLTFASMVGYAVIYTVFLKRATPQNIVIGGAAGAMPPVLGWTAVTGQVSSDALLLFLIIFCWTPPHFWALALYREKEYSSVGIPMLPVTHGRRFTQLYIVCYTLLLAAVSVMPFATRMAGLPYLFGALVLNGYFIGYAIALYRNYSDRLARKTFLFSIQYLAWLFAFMLVDHYREPIFGFLGRVAGG